MNILTHLFGSNKKAEPKQETITKEVMVLEKEPINSKSIIEEIHETFYSEVDRLLETAKISKSLDTDKQDLIDKRNRLVAQGFTKSIECKEAEKEIERLEILKKENIKKAELIEAINYFSVKYPLYKFITEESIKKICAKYNLVYSTVDNYIGTVPDKNLKEIENFKIQDEDFLYMIRSVNYTGWGNVNSRISNFATFLRYKKEPFSNEFRGHMWSDEIFKALPIIAAPVKDFDTKNMDLKDFKLTNKEILDPVVMEQVHYNGKGYFLIKTAWGPESSDDLVSNPKMN